MRPHDAQFAAELADGAVLTLSGNTMMGEVFHCKEMITTHGAHIKAIEHHLGIPAGAIHRVDARTVNSWIVALRRADTALTGARR
jgi:hypothetical protein